MNENLVEIKTVQSGEVRNLIDALKDILTDANFQFSKEGIKCTAMDASHTVLVHLKLNADKFDFFHCEKKLTVGIAMSNFYKFIKTMNNNDILTLYIKKNDVNVLGIKMENSDKNSVIDFSLNLMDLNDETLEISPVEFDSILTLPSNDFQKYCRDFSGFSHTLEIQNIGDELIFKCNGDIGSSTQIIKPNNSSGLSFNKNTDNIIQGNFALKHLVLFTKCTGLCSTIKMFLKNDYPLIIEYSIANLGTIKLCLAPKSDKKE